MTRRVDQGDTMGRDGTQSRGAYALAFVVGCAAAVSAVTGRAQQPPTTVELAPRAEKARALAHLYSEKLRAGVVQALKETGPVGAIGACNTLAPELNSSVTDESTFEISRTAFRVRNQENLPDAWELVALELMQKALTGGADPKTLETYDVVTTNEGQRLFRYMRPIIMREPCLACHGPNVAQEVKAEIAKYYTDDKAVGFNVGDLRGAFSLVQQLD